MNNVDWSIYDSQDTSKKTSTGSKSSIPKKQAEADWTLYDSDVPAKQQKNYFGQYAHLTPEEYESLTPEKKKELQEYVPLTGFAKGFLSGASIGGTEHVPGLKIEEHESGSGLGEFVGVAPTITAIHKLLTLPSKFLGLGKWALRGYKTGAAAATGATHEAAREAIAGEELSPSSIGTQGLIFGGLDAILRGSPKVYNWFKTLPKSQAEKLVSGVIPEDLPLNDYKFFQNEIVPELQANARKEYQTLLQQTIEANEKEYAQKLANVKAEHEQNLIEKANKQQLNNESFEASQKEYKERLNQIAAQHEAELAEIEKANAQAQKDFQEAQRDFEHAQNRDAAVNATMDRVGEISSPEGIINKTKAGEATIETVKSTADSDYKLVKQAYDESIKLNSQVETPQPSLVHYLIEQIKELSKIPALSTPKQKILNTAEKILNEAVIFDDAKNIVGYKPINNQVLLGQAQEMRHMIDYDFNVGNPTKIFQPLIDELQTAAESAANFTRNDAAYQANIKARNMYRQWSETYNNDHIKKFRDLSNKNPIGTFESTLNIDDFKNLDNVLSKTGQGKQLSNQIKREVVEKNLKPFFENPKKIGSRDYKKAISELTEILNPEEIAALEKEMISLKETPGVADIRRMAKPPESPKIKEITSVKIPTFKGELKPVEEIKSVKIPLMPEVTPTKEMRAASKIMEISPEEAMKMSNTPSGLKRLKDHLSQTESQKKLFDNIAKRKVREIIHEGKVKQKYSGNQLYDVVNKSDNFEMLSEILGEDITLDLLESAEKIGEKQMSIENLKKLGKKTATIKAAVLFGIL